VVVEVTRDVKSGDRVLLKKGSLVKGTVTEVQAFSKGSSAQLEIAFDHVTAKDGEQIPAHFAVYALAAQLEKPGDIYATEGYKGLGTSASVSGRTVAPAEEDFTPQTTGIFGFQGIELHPLVRMTPPTCAISSSSQNIVLENGTRMVLAFVGQ
jgi:hypothetical protein